LPASIHHPDRNGQFILRSGAVLPQMTGPADVGRAGVLSEPAAVLASAAG
jgi:hypothetical protein